MENELSEHVTVVTKYPGQHLHVTLEREFENSYGEVDRTCQAELIIEPGYRVTLGHEGVKVEKVHD